MKEKTHTRWGILGLGKIAGKFASDLALVADARLSAVASRSKMKARAFQVAAGAEYAFGSYEEMLDSGTVDIIYIATPHPFHKEWSIRALERGIGVLCEKPATINSSELRDVLNASQQYSSYYMEALWSRFLPAFEHLHGLKTSGHLGAVREVEAEFCFAAAKNYDGRLYNMDLGGGTILDIGVYCVFVAYLMLGTPESITAEGELAHTGADQTCTMRMTYSNGASAHLHTSILYASKMPARINFDRGTVLLDSRWHEAAGMTILEAGAESVHLDMLFDGRGFCQQIASSQQAWQEGRIENPKWSHQNSLDVMNILDEVRRQVGVIYPSERTRV